MPCRESIFSPGNYFHVFCRGNEKKDIFLEHGDYERFLCKMKEYKIIHRVGIICYCLMPNHFHLLLRQNTKEPISSFIHRLTVSYSMYFNKRCNRVGHLFQGRFKAKLIKRDDYLLHLSRYIHLNPLEIINPELKLEDYPWSSYPEYLNVDGRKICDNEIILQQFNSTELYKRFVDSIILENELIKIEDFIIEPK